MSVQLLDCTLREGAHLNDGEFGRKTVINIINSLSKAGVDFIELGFLREVEDNRDSTIYNSIEKVNTLLSECDTSEAAEYVVMVRPGRFDISNLTEPEGQCSTVRVAFYKHRLEAAIEYGKQARKLGYDVFLNPIAISSYDDSEIRSLIKRANDFDPRGVNMVDTFGALDHDRSAELYEQYTALDDDIKIGLHYHQNLTLQVGNCINIITDTDSEKRITVDGSLYGMGRSPGNLQIEVISEYLNSNYGAEYEIDALFDVIEDVIKPMKHEYDWGYSPAYFISAIHNVHRTYGEKLKDKSIPLAEIDDFCRSISGTEAAMSYEEGIVDDYFDV